MEFVSRITLVCLETCIRFKVLNVLPQHWLTLEESRFRFMVLILTNCSVQLKNQLTVSLPRQCSAGFQVLHAIKSLSDPKKESYECCRYTILLWKQIILLKVHKLRKRRIDLSICSNLADGILTVTLKGGMPQKYTGRKSLAKIFSDY